MMPYGSGIWRVSYPLGTFGTGWMAFALKLVLAVQNWCYQWWFAVYCRWKKLCWKWRPHTNPTEWHLSTLSISATYMYVCVTLEDTSHFLLWSRYGCKRSRLKSVFHVRIGWLWPGHSHFTRFCSALTRHSFQTLIEQHFKVQFFRKKDLISYSL